MMKKIVLSLFFIIYACVTYGKALVDRDVIESFKRTSLKAAAPISLIVFFHSAEEKKIFLEDLNSLAQVKIQNLDFMPAVAAQIPPQFALLEFLANHSAVAQISSYQIGKKELDINTQALQLVASDFYPNASNWWSHGYTGRKGVIGLIDDGIDPTHPALANKHLIIRKEEGSRFNDFPNGVRSAHGTGIACIYSSTDAKYKGIAYGAKTFVSGLSGEETPDIPNILLTLSSLDWMLKRAEQKPTIINYSMGNGGLYCPYCPEWSGLAKVVDYVVNHEKILWVKSGGNAGYVEPTDQAPYTSTLTVPSDNYNALTIANINTVINENGQSFKTANRDKHRIHSTSSRGPTPSGRRKPDLAAPGFNTRTCAPDPQIYGFKYSVTMDYKDGFRLMGGTSSAAPHVGAAALLLQDAGIKNPMAIKALLINSADTWTDSDKAEPVNGLIVNHHLRLGSEWNRTYGWGYINMQKAFEERKDLIESELSPANPKIEYSTVLGVGEKITLVHERRVGYFKDSSEWRLSHLALELIDKETQQIIARDDSPIDTVHQVANCIPTNQKVCSDKTKTIHALVRVKLLSSVIDGSATEPFALLLKNKE